MTKLINHFLNKTLSVFRLGRVWFNKLSSSIIESGRTISYIETVNPRQSDTFHKEIKFSDINIFKRSFEKITRNAVKKLKLGGVKVAIDVTEDPYWGKNGSFNTRSKVHVKSDESWQYVNLSIVDPKFIPLMSLPYRQIDNLDDLTIELLEYLRTLPLKVSLVLFDRGFYHWRLIDYLENTKGKRSLPYLILVPKNKTIKEYINKTDGTIGVFRHFGKYSKDKSVWKPKTKIVICKNKNIDWSFATNQKAGLNLIINYKKRWNIETGFRIHDEVKIKSKSSNPKIRFYYHLLGMVLILMWRLNNKFKRYVVFKKYLKLLEELHIRVIYCLKPPPEEEIL